MDRLAALFLLLLFIIGLSESLLTSGQTGRRIRLGVAMTGFIVVIGDAVLLVAAVPLAILSLGRAEGWRTPVIGVACVVGLLALLIGSVPGMAGLAGGASYGVLRERAAPASPIGTITAAGLLMAAVAVSTGAGLRTTRQRQGMSSGSPTALALLLVQYLLLRIGIDLGASMLGTPGAAAILIVGGAASMAALSLRAILVDDLRHATALLVWAPTGLTVAALGTMAAARSLDLPGPQAATAIAMITLAVVQVLVGCSLSALCETTIAEQGAVDLRRMGGGARSMPRTMILVGFGIGCLAWIPALPGYTASWILLHATLATTRFMATRWMVAAALIGMMLAMAGMITAALAAVRIAAVVALDRPRTPRAAAALDIGTGRVRGHAALLSLTLAVGMAPGPLARRAVVPDAVDSGATGGIIVATSGGSGCAPLVLLLLLLISVQVVRAWRARRGGPVRSVPPWNDGMKADPPWLPFGDPVLQPTARTIPAMLASDPVVRVARRTMIGPASWMLRWKRRSVRATWRLGITITTGFRERPVLPIAAAVATILAGWWLGR